MTLAGFAGKPAYFIYKWVWSGVDLLYPPNCGGCGELGARWCSDCEASTQQISSPFCKMCGIPLNLGVICSRCKNQPHRFKSLRSWAVYNGSIRKAILRLKYTGDLALSDVLSRPLIKLFNEQKWHVDVITSVPIGGKRAAERGYNQAALLAYPVALKVGIPYHKMALKKLRNVRSQVGLSIIERYRNVEGIFQANKSIVEGKSILVIDDVITSGATMDACADVLRREGAVEVFGLTLAHAGASQFIGTSG